MKLYTFINSRKILVRINIVLVSLFVSGLLLVGYLATASTPTIQPEHFTELYFEDHAYLPRDTQTNKVNTFSFTVRNREYKDTTYLYEVYIDVEGVKTVIDTGEFRVRQNTSKTITESYTFVVPVERARVVVNLINKKQLIAFWLKSSHETT